MENGILENELKITSTSQELFIEAIRTLPLELRHFEVFMNANGIQSPTSKEEKENYLYECSKNNVMPFTNIQLLYDNDSKLFKPLEGYSICEMYRNLSDENKKATTQGIIKGGKIHRIKFEAWIPAQKGFEKFREQVLEEMLQQSYKIDWGDLALTTYHLTGYNQGDYTDTNISFGTGYVHKGMRLKIGHKISEEDERKVIGWFKDLIHKYDSKNLDLFTSTS